MKKYFVLKDFDSEVLNISFKEISECISFDYCWSILWIEGSGRNALISMETLEQSINQSEAGIIISFEKLQSYRKH